MSLSEDQFLAAIAQQESGGNYSSVNHSSGALGKYQVMPSNVASWTRQALGHSLTPQQFLADPAAQEAVARTILGGYYQKYGARGAAAAWYSGDPALANDYSPQNGGPSIGSYVDEVLSKAGVARTSASGTNGTLTNPLSPEAIPAPVIDFNTINADFASVAGLLNAVPELKQWAQNIVNKQIRVDTDAGKQQAEQLLEQTKWWKTTNDAQKTWEQLRITNPGQAVALQKQAAADIQQKAGQLGVALQPSQLQNLVNLKVTNGYSDAQIQTIMGSYLGKISPSNYGGAAASDLNTLKQWSIDYGVPIGGPTQQQWVTRIEQGYATLDTYKNLLMQQAAVKYPALAKQLNDGLTVKDVASTYTNQMANLLEVNPDSIDFNTDPYIQKALQYNPATTGAAVSSGSGSSSNTSPTSAAQALMPMYSFEQMVKKDPRWLNTDNAKQGALATIHEIGSEWGFSS